LDTSFLKRRGESWYVRVLVPKHLQAQLGKPEIVKALGTKSQREAMRLRWPVVAEIQQSFGPRSKLPDLAEALEFAKVLGAARAQATSDDDGLSNAAIYAGLAADRAAELEQSKGADAARRWFDIAANRALPLSIAVDRWLAETARYTQQTRQQHRAAVKELEDFLGDAPLTAVNRAAAGRFVSERLLGKIKGKTVNRKISSLSQLWKWAAKRGHVEENPWTNQGVPKDEVVSESDDKRPFTPAELRTLLFPGPKEQAVRDLMMLSLFTGARINELCELKPGDVENGGIRIRAGKTKAAARWLPIPLGIRGVVQRRAQDGDWLFPEAKPGGFDKKRSWNVGKRAGRQIDKALPELGSVVDFHSLRRSYSTACERAQLYRPTHDELMGHKKGSLALDLYSGGQSREQLRKAQRAVSRKIVGWLRGRSDD